MTRPDHAGNSVPILALIHGWGMGRAIWSPCLAPLQEAAQLHQIDLPGYGEMPDTGQSFTETAQSLIDTLPAGTILCGWSLGALLAMQASLLAPKHFGGLVLVGATPCFMQRDDWTAAQPASLLREFAASVAQNSQTTLQRFVALFNRGDTHARPIGRAIARSVLSSTLPTETSLLTGLDWLRDVDLRARIPEIACPVCLIHGEHDPLMPASAARWLADSLPRAQLEMFLGAAHAPFLNSPEHFASIVGNFLHAHRID